MPNDYAYKITQCDVPEERRAALDSYRAKRRVWLSWISTDERHAIWSTLHSMVWTDVAFKTSWMAGLDVEVNNAATEGRVGPITDRPRKVLP
jgi:hypothetical protein